MLEISTEEYDNKKLFELLLTGVAPRPIAFASTVDSEGNKNLSPFSFYNAFGVNPSTLIFSPSRRGRDNTTKHTFENLKEVPEVVINAVNFSMVHQMSLSSTEYPKGVNEFEKAGFTQLPSIKIRPYRVKQSPLQFECKVRDIIEISGKPGSGNLIICEIVYIHIDEKVIDENGTINPNRLDLVGRLGGNYYVRASGKALFTIPKPLTTLGIGVDSLPQSVKMSTILSGNDLGQLGNMEKLPDETELISLIKNDVLRKKVSNNSFLHQYAKQLISNGEVYAALKVLLAFGN